MANMQEVEVKINKDLIERIKWLQSYKNIADEVLTILTTVDIFNEELKLTHIQGLALRALNIAAHEEPYLGWGEDDLIVRLFMQAWRQEDFERWDKLPDWVEINGEQFRDILHRFSYLLTDRNAKVGQNE